MLYALCAALALALLGLDQWVKHYVTVHIPLGEAQPLLPGLVELRTVHNYGAAWSSLAGMRWMLVAITGVIIAAVAVILIRRIVRDARTRGASAKATIAMWNSVRRGEEENIFPYQESADVMFNSALIYELAVLKLYAEPLLFSIQPGEPEYNEAKRLLKFLDYFVGVPSEAIPHNSILREFVGGGCFDV